MYVLDHLLLYMVTLTFDTHLQLLKMSMFLHTNQLNWSRVRFFLILFFSRAIVVICGMFST